jgi:hypothetical protein
MHVPVSERQGGRHYWRPEVIDGSRRANDVDDGIDRAHFVEVNSLEWYAVHASFGFAQSSKNATREIDGGCWQRAASNKLDDLAVMTLVLSICDRDVELASSDRPGAPRLRGH